MNTHAHTAGKVQSSWIVTACSSTVICVL